jgi:hypothetical protein
MIILTTMKPRPHRWSGWPGAYCQDCHADDVIETALGCDLLDIDEYGHCKWCDEETKEYFEFINSHCLAGLPQEEKDEIRKQAELLYTDKVKAVIRSISGG